MDAVESLFEPIRQKHGAFSILLEKHIRDSRIKAQLYTHDHWRALSIVALTLDARILEECASDACVEYAVVKIEEGGQVGINPNAMVLYTLEARSITHAFYMMCADACDKFFYKDRIDEVSKMDPEYRTMNIVDLLVDVAERADWNIRDLWDAFCEFRTEVHPYYVVPATRDHYLMNDFLRRN